MNKHICIHGHFYQPPRENPWLDEVEQQDSAFPYHDWNERVTAECYAPNTASRILDKERRIVDIVNNYSKISFNFGPTLLSWMERHDTETYKAVLSADKESMKNFSGHGSAIAQCYNHMIMPLANARDKFTQVVWGVRDFEFRFGRKPEGMWLPETAVDLETLDIMAESGIKFVILAPKQAHKTRKKGDKEWKDVSGEKIDPKIPYACALPSGKEMNVFFYDGPVSQDVAFGDLLKSGENFAGRLAGLFLNDSEKPQLVHIATDGETYGHHHNFGDMSLAYCLYHIELNKLAKITIYGEYLEMNKPVYEVEICENSSWSCAHGVERWKSDCGCCIGINRKWNQKWRAPLRGALDWLRDTLVKFFEESAGELLIDPWAARNDYINVILDRSLKSLESFIDRNKKRDLTREEKVRLIYLMEIQRHAMLMYTSCGWFFDEVSGIETVQIIQYAARAMHLAKIAGNLSLEDSFVSLLERIPSNIPKYKDGTYIYEHFVKPAVVDFLRVGAHYAVASLFIDYPEKTSIYNYTAGKIEYNKDSLGRHKLVTGKIKLKYELTHEKSMMSFAVLHLGDQNLVGGAREFQGEESFLLMKNELGEAFQKTDISEIIRLIDKHFGEHSYSIWHLFKDEQSAVIKQIFDATMQEKEAFFHQIKDNDYPLIQTMRDLNVPIPKVFTEIVKHVLISDIQKLLENGELDLGQLKKLISEADKWDIEPDKVRLGFIIGIRVNSLMENLQKNPRDLLLLYKVEEILSVLDLIPIELNIWKSQNILFSLTKDIFIKMFEKKNEGNKKAEHWVDSFVKISEYMKVKIL